jgi:HK97 family phage prohead protease
MTEHRTAPADGDGGLVRFATSVGSRQGGRTFDVVCCTAGVNQQGARVDNASWDLSRFASNPVLLYGHADHSGILENVRPEDTLPIGKASNVRVEGDSLLATIEFAPASVNPFAERVYQAFAGGYLNAVSVGFRPHTVAYETVAGREVAVLSDCELYEISVVPLPADAGAVAVRNSASLTTFAAMARSHMTVRDQAALAAPPPPANDKPAAEAAPPPPADKPVEQAADVTCPECGAVNPGGSKFCNQCGESLTESAAEGAPPPASEQAACDPVRQGLRAFTATRSRAEALGVVTAWKLAAEALPAAQARVAELEGVQLATERRTIVDRLTAERKITPAMRPWAESCDLAGLKAFAAVAAPVAGLVDKAVLQPSAAGRWEDLTPMAKHALKLSDPAAFEALLADHKSRAGR